MPTPKILFVPKAYDSDQAYVWNENKDATADLTCWIVTGKQVL